MEVSRISLKNISEKLRAIIRDIDGKLGEREERRDRAIKTSRDVIRLSGLVINAIQRENIIEAKKHLESLEEKLEEFLDTIREDAWLYYSGLANNALSEYAEAAILYNIIVKGELPGPRDLRVNEIAYLQGLGDTIGELRRIALDFMRRDRLEEAEKLVELMEIIYQEMRALEYPEAMMPGVRHKIDVARRLVDDTKTLYLEIRGRRDVLEALGEKKKT